LARRKGFERPRVGERLAPVYKLQLVGGIGGQTLDVENEKLSHAVALFCLVKGVVYKEGWRSRAWLIQRKFDEEAGG